MWEGTAVQQLVRELPNSKYTKEVELVDFKNTRTEMGFLKAREKKIFLRHYLTL